MTLFHLHQHQRRLTLVNTLSIHSMLVFAGITTLLLLLNYLNYPAGGAGPLITLACLVLTFTFASSRVLAARLLPLKVALLIGSFCAALALNISYFGPFAACNYLLLTLLILCTSMFETARIGRIFASALLVGYAAISIAVLGAPQPLIIISSNSLTGLVVLAIHLILCWEIFVIVRIGLAETAQAHLEAESTAAEFAKLNSQLEEVVLIRGRAIEKSLFSQVEEIYKSSVIGSIARGLLHDIYGPLTVIKGVVTVLRQKPKVDKQERELALAALGELEKRILKSRQLLARNDVQEEFEVADVINQTIAEVQSRCYQLNVTVTWQPPRTAILLNGNRSLLYLVVLNILQNALEELSASERKRDLWVEVSGGEIVEIKITDNGRGISAQQAEYLFEAGHSQKHTARNLGFGLYFVRHVLRTYFKGEITAHSSPGSWTCFRLELPLDAGSEAELTLATSDQLTQVTASSDQ